MTYEITGTEAVLLKLRTLEQTLATAPLLEDVAKAALPTLKIYPPERAGQRYVRSHELERGWQYGTPVSVASGRVVELFNPVAYAGLVYGPDQAEIHKDRWKTVAQLRDQIAPQVLAGFEAWVKQVIG